MTKLRYHQNIGVFTMEYNFRFEKPSTNQLIYLAINKRSVTKGTKTIRVNNKFDCDRYY